MVDKTEISKPIEIKDNSVERVALDLMEKIAMHEVGSSMSQNKSVYDEQKKRDYWLKLYNQCHRTVYSANANIDLILKD